MIKQNNNISFPWVLPKEKSYEHIARIIIVVIYFELSQYANTYTQTESLLINHILQFSLKLIQNLETFVPYYMENDLKEYVESKMTKIDDLQRRNNGFENFVKYFESCAFLKYLGRLAGSGGCTY